jgi:hypothetical protein
MTAAKFASLTPDLLARKGEAAPSVVVPPAVEFFADKGRLAAAAPLRSQRSGSAPVLVIHDAAKADAANKQAVVHLSESQTSRRPTVTLPADDADTIGYIAVKKGTPRDELLRLARQAGGEIVVPVGVARNNDGTVLLSIFGAPENFSYDRATGGWAGAEGSSFEAVENVFDDPTGWSVIIGLAQSGQPPSVELCHNGDCAALTIAG